MVVPFRFLLMILGVIVFFALLTLWLLIIYGRLVDKYNECVDENHALTMSVDLHNNELNELKRSMKKDS